MNENEQEFNIVRYILMYSFLPKYIISKLGLGKTDDAQRLYEHFFKLG